MYGKSKRSSRIYNNVIMTNVTNFLLISIQISEKYKHLLDSDQIHFCKNNIDRKIKQIKLIILVKKIVIFAY